MQNTEYWTMRTKLEIFVHLFIFFITFSIWFVGELGPKCYLDITSYSCILSLCKINLVINSSILTTSLRASFSLLIPRAHLWNYYVKEKGLEINYISLCLRWQIFRTTSNVFGWIYMIWYLIRNINYSVFSPVQNKTSAYVKCNEIFYLYCTLKLHDDAPLKLHLFHDFSAWKLPEHATC